MMMIATTSIELVLDLNRVLLVMMTRPLSDRETIRWVGLITWNIIRLRDNTLCVEVHGETLQSFDLKFEHFSAIEIFVLNC